MRTLPRLLGSVVLLGIVALGGCNRNGGSMFGGNSSASGDSSDQGSQKQPAKQQKPGAASGDQVSEPAGSVTGDPSAASDRGSADAVAHRSVAQPGAPQGTVPADSAKPTAKTPPPQQP